MSEEKIESQDTAPTKGDTNGEHSFLEGTYKGQKVTWDEDTARNLAQKGLDYETRKAKLEAEKQQFAAEGEEFDRFKQWRQTLQHDPKRAEAVMRAYENPDVVLNGGVDGGDMAEAGHHHLQDAPAAPKEVFELKNTVEQLQAKLASMTAESSQAKAKDRLVRATDSFSFLSDNTEARDLAMQMAEGLMASDGDMSPEGAAAVAAEKVKNLMRGQSQSKLDRKGKGDEMRTVPTQDGVPVPAVTGKKKEHDPRKRRLSTLRSDVMDQLQNGLFRDRFSNF